jgi:PAS domain S-box-containing protein
LAGRLVRGRHPWAISWRAAWLVLVGGLVLAVVVSQTTQLPRTPGAVLVVGIVATLLLSAVARLAYAAQDRAEARAAAEERLSDFLDTASDLIEITAPDGKLLYANQAWRKVFGYDEAEQSTVSTAVTVTPEYAEAYHGLRRRVLAGEKVGEFEGVFLTRQRRRVVLAVRTTCGYENGKAVTVRSMLRDVTPQRAAEEAQARLVETLEATTDFVGIGNGRGRGVYINRAGRRMIGIGADDDVSLLGLSAILSPPARQHQIDIALPAAIRDGVWEGETTLQTRDGREIPVSQVLVAHKSSQGGVWFVSTILRDISTQRRREAELRESEERFRMLSDAATDGIAVSRAGRFLEVNRAWCRMFGYTELELEDIPAAAVVVPEERARLYYIINKNIPSTRHVVCLRKDGSTFEAEAAGTPIIYKGSPARVTVMRDITEWKRLDRMKNEFVSTVSHELRTPLTSIRGALGLLESGVGGALTPQAQELVRIGRGNTERLIRLIGDMLDLDKIEAGRLELHLSTLMPAELVRTAVDGVQVIAEQFQVRIEEHVEAHRTLEGDHDRVIQVLTNFLSNAVKFSPPGSVVKVSAVMADAPDPPAAGGGGRTAGRAPVRFVVENPGPGIAPGDIRLLFRRFQQIDGSDGRHRGGTGLGLAISKAIVEQHGGRIGVDSEPGRKTTFWFELPAAAAKNIRLTPLNGVTVL